MSKQNLLYLISYVTFLVFINSEVPAKDARTVAADVFNSRLREYSEGDINKTAVQTMQIDKLRRYIYSQNKHRPLKYKDAHDNIVSGSEHSRGLPYDENPAYENHEYEENTGHGYYQHVHPYEYGHIEHHPIGPYYDHNFGHHYHHKYHDLGLTAKSILLPVAGLAILGAAAALISNPVLLQLGVISGRKRRDTDDKKTNHVDSLPSQLNWTRFDKNITIINDVKRANKNKTTVVMPRRMVKKSLKVGGEKAIKRKPINELNFVPVPLKMWDKHTK